MNAKLLGALAGVFGVWGAIAAPMTFDFKDPKGVNAATFHMDGMLEAISGNANGISGTVTFDPDNPAATTGSIIVTTASLHVPNTTMDGHMHSPAWLDAAKYPDIKFVAAKLENINTSDGVTSADASGTLTIKGISKEMTAPIKLTYLKDKLGERIPKMQGDILMLRAHFNVSRSDFNIQAHKNEAVVSDTIEINLTLSGSCPTS
jgi:polyisoprenoid-binding protein YceI